MKLKVISPLKKNFSNEAVTFKTQLQQWIFCWMDLLSVNKYMYYLLM